MFTKEYLQPNTMFDGSPLGFTQVVTSPPGKLVFISGQVPWDINRELVGGSDLAGQAQQVLKNVGNALVAAGAKPSDVTLLRVFFVDYQPEYAGIVLPLIAQFFQGGPPPASTWIGVQSLANPLLRIEMEAIAVIEASS